MPKLIRSTKVFVIAGLGLAAVLLAGSIILSGLPGTVPSPAARESGSGSPPGADGQPPGDSPGDPIGGSPGDRTAAPGTLPPAASPDPERPLEVPPGSIGAAAGPLPASHTVAEPKVLLPLPLPPADAAERRLVASFPEQLVPLVPGAHVLTSSIMSSGNTLQAGLSAGSSSASADILAFYAGHYESLGFQPGEPETSGGITTATWSYGTSAVTVSIGPGAGPEGTPYFVFAVLRAGS